MWLFQVFSNGAIQKEKYNTYNNQEKIYLRHQQLKYRSIYTSLTKTLRFAFTGNEAKDILILAYERRKNTCEKL